MRSFIIIFALISCPSFAADGRLIQILNQITHRFCAAILERDGEAAHYGFHKVTPNTIITPVDVEDVEVYTRAFEIGTNPEVMNMSGDFLNAGLIHRLFSIGVDSLEDLAHRERGILNLVVRLTDGKTIIGFAQIAKTDVTAAFLKGLARDRSRWFEISFHFDPKYWRKGYGTEVVEALVQVSMISWAEGVYAQTLMSNETSGRVLKRAGFREFERVKSASLNDSEGTVHYAITREEWKRRLSGSGKIIGMRDGRELAVLRNPEQVPTWAVVEIDKKDLQARSGPRAISGRDRLLQLSTKPSESNVGVFVSVPVQWFMLNYFSSIYEIDQIFSECVVNGKFDRSLFRMNLETRLTNTLRSSLNYDPSRFFPENFLHLTIFEKRRIYQKLDGIIVLDEKGRNAVNREPVITEMR